MHRAFIACFLAAALTVPVISADSPNPAQPFADAVWGELFNETAPPLPRIPDVPDVPTVPPLPDVPHLPPLPTLPPLPDVPDLPELPGVPETPEEVEMLKALILDRVARMTCPAAVELDQHAIGGMILDEDSIDWGYITTRHLEEVITHRVPIYETVIEYTEATGDGLLTEIDRATGSLVSGTLESVEGEGGAIGDLLFDEVEGRTGVEVRKLVGWKTVEEIKEGHADITLLGDYDREYIDWERYDRTVTVDLDTGMWFLLHDDAELIQICDGDETEVLERLPAWDGGEHDYFAWWTGWYGKWETKHPSHHRHAHGHGHGHHHHHWAPYWWGEDGWYVTHHTHDARLTTAEDYQAYDYLETCHHWHGHGLLGHLLGHHHGHDDGAHHCHHGHHGLGHATWSHGQALADEVLVTAFDVLAEIEANLGDAAKQEPIRDALREPGAGNASGQSAGSGTVGGSLAGLLGLLGLGGTVAGGPSLLRLIRRP